MNRKITKVVDENITLMKTEDKYYKGSRNLTCLTNKLRMMNSVGMM